MEKTFTVPSGHSYTIREQNGGDDDILSSKVGLEKLMNITNFISAIVVSTDYTQSGKLTPEEAFTLPVLDRDVILIQSRIHSLGKDVDFEFEWKPGIKTNYTQDLEELIFKDYGVIPEKEEIDSKPDAVPYYPIKQFKDIKITTTSGKVFLFDINTNDQEVIYINLPLSEQTKNKKLTCRNLRLVMDGKPVAVTNFEMFSVQEMREINKAIKEVDPIYSGNVFITNPDNPNQRYPINIFSLDSFFYLEEI